MTNIYEFVNEYLIIDYSPSHQALYCYISKIVDDNLYLITTKEFEKSGLLIGDTISCKIEEDEKEFFFQSKIINMERGIEGLHLIITPTSKIEEYYNLRTEKRLNFKFVAFTDKNTLASVKNISASGILITTTDEYQKGDTIILRLVTSYPHIEYTLCGQIVRVINSKSEKKDYGVKIEKFSNSLEEEKYKEFVEKIYRELLPF